MSHHNSLPIVDIIAALKLRKQPVILRRRAQRSGHAGSWEAADDSQPPGFESGLAPVAERR